MGIAEGLHTLLEPVYVYLIIQLQLIFI